MQIGAVLPQTEIGADLGSVRAYAQTVQDLGFEHLVSSDHVLGADPAGHPGWNRPQNHKTVVHEPFVLFGFIAGVAPKLGLLTSVVILPQRQATLVAKQAAEVDGWLREAGRDRASFGIEARLNATDGTPDDWRKTVEEWRGRGASHLSVGTSGA